MALDITLRLIGSIILIALNAFFVVSEFALTRVRQFDKEEFQGHPGLEKAWEMTKRLEIHLTGCQLGISSTSVLLGVVAEPAFTELLRPVFALFGLGEGTARALSVVIGLVLINLIHQVWGEQAPTYLGIERPKAIARYCAIPLSWWTWLTYPIILVGDGLAKGTLALFGVQFSRSWAEEEAEETEAPEAEDKTSPRTKLSQRLSQLLKGDLREDRRQEVVRALEIGELPTRDIMVSRDNVAAMSTERSLDDNLAVAGESLHSRYPLVGASLDDYRGNLYVPDILAAIGELRGGAKTLIDLVRPTMYVDAELPVSELIDEFQRQKQEIAMVRDGDRLVGLITLTDAVEAIVGSAEDPLDLEAEAS
ncbi:MAG: hemolysin family protein [Trueperaceae bacterium]|nr:hemolysin family protein [Trueperaceae bacterium]